MPRTERYEWDNPPAMCRECGVKVQDFHIHDEFHARLQMAKPSKPVPDLMAALEASFTPSCRCGGGEG